MMYCDKCKEEFPHNPAGNICIKCGNELRVYNYSKPDTKNIQSTNNKNTKKILIIVVVSIVVLSLMSA